MDAREDKLPVWAQHKLAGLRQRLAEAEKRIEELNDGPVDTNTIARAYDDHPQRLGFDEYVRFELDEAWSSGVRFHLMVHIQHRREGSYLEVQGVGALSVRPQSSNVVQIWPVIR